jgi:hypothetical protein
MVGGLAEVAACLSPLRVASSHSHTWCLRLGPCPVALTNYDSLTKSSNSGQASYRDSPKHAGFSYCEASTGLSPGQHCVNVGMGCSIQVCWSSLCWGPSSHTNFVRLVMF